jgi:hypothetical protein
MTLGIEISAGEGYAYFIEQVEFFFEGIDGIQLDLAHSHSYNEFIQKLYSL